MAVTTRGALHRAKNLPCQDYSCVKTYNNKVVAVASDGAGSAPFSKIGAKILCETLCDMLIKSSFENIKKDIIKAVETAREKLILHRRNKSKSADDLINFAATMVGVFYYRGRGIFFHIGDGAGIAFQNNHYDNFVISEPENGTFSCETYFYTMDDWQDCLRFTPFTQANRIILMTDGVTGFVFSDDFYKIRRQFFVPIVEFLEKEPHKKRAQKALYNTLNDSKAQRLNADDKTFLWIKLP